METYNDVIVRLTPELDTERAHALLAQATQSLDSALEWEHLETTDGVAVFTALAGSGGWEYAEAASEALLEAGSPEIALYLTHDEDAEAQFVRKRKDEPQPHLAFLVSTAYLDGYLDEDGDDDEEEDSSEEAEPLPEESADHGDRPLIEADRHRLGENAYCWKRFDQWVEGMPVLHRHAHHRELIESVVGERETA